VDAVYVHFFMQKWGEERIFPHPNIYYRTQIFLTSVQAKEMSHVENAFFYMGLIK